MLENLLKQMLPPGAFDEILAGAQTAMKKIAEFDERLTAIDRRLYNIEVDIQTILTGEVQAEKVPVFTSPATLEHKGDALE